jgi:hypothetical protein
MPVKRFGRSSDLWWISHVSVPRSAISFKSSARGRQFLQLSRTSNPHFNLRYLKSAAEAVTAVTSEPAMIHLAYIVVLLARACLPILATSKCNLTWRKMTLYR